jgi:hypothetical protein
MGGNLTAILFFRTVMVTTPTRAEYYFVEANLKVSLRCSPILDMQVADFSIEDCRAALAMT